jgi:hypothetical protein
MNSDEKDYIDLFWIFPPLEMLHEAKSLMTKFGNANLI